MIQQKLNQYPTSTRIQHDLHISQKDITISKIIRIQKKLSKVGSMEFKSLTGESIDKLNQEFLDGIANGFI